ncbi:prefoldin alpha-like protein, partial [Kipferlia bialata]|eukprot:g11548.t1
MFIDIMEFRDAVLGLIRQHKTKSESGSKTLSHIGQNIYSRAEIINPQQMLYSVGCGIYLEVTLEEAKEMVEARIE